MLMGATRRLGPGARRGMTLLELLIAMLVLLVGIWTVAKGFPTLLNLIRGEGDRTIMSRLAEKEMERYARDPEGLPDAIVGPAGISPYDDPEDLMDDTRGPNAEESVNDVIGETFRVPSAYLAPGASYVAGTSCQYVLRQGPAAWTDPAGVGGMPYVYVLIPLEEQREDPGAGAGVLADNHFYVDAAAGEVIAPATAYTDEGAAATTVTAPFAVRHGRVVRPWSVDEIVVDYGWAETAAAGAAPALHYAQGEVVNDITGAGPLVGRVHPAHLGAGVWGQMLAGQTRVWARHYLTREAFGQAYPQQPGNYVLENRHGVTLRFHPQDTGLTLKVDYRLKTEPGDRRPLMMIEEQTIPSSQSRADAGGIGFADIRLSVRNLDDGNDIGKLFATDTQGTALAVTEESNVLAVDLTDGNIYLEGSPFTISDPNLLPMLEDGYRDGVVCFPLQIAGSPAPYIGHPMRFYYRTLDRNNLQMQKAPRSFVDRRTAESYQATHLPAGINEAASLAEVDYRTYDRTYQPPTGNPGLRIGILTLGQWLDEDADPGTPPIWSEARNCQGMTLAVNYQHWTGNPARQQTAWGELHTVSTTGTKVALNCATLADDTTTAWDDYPITILAVNGVSARVRAWWLSDKGVQKRADIESCFLPTALGLLPRVR